jgi:hypothetical protein
MCGEIINKSPLFKIMASKKCVICQVNDADYCVKGTNECYCQNCGREHFGDLGLLVKIEDDAKRLNEFIEKKIASDDKKEPKNDYDDTLIDVKIKNKRVSKKEKNERNKSDG